LAQVKVPSLAVQCLVENSIKHVAAQRSEGAALRVSARRLNDRLQIQVVDDGPGFSLTTISPDHGLGNLSARLELLFRESGQLNVRRDNGNTIVSISFPAEA